MSCHPPPYYPIGSDAVCNDPTYFKIHKWTAGIPPCSLPGSIDTPRINSNVNPGCYNCGSHFQQHFPGLREGPNGLTTREGGRYIVTN
uniref:Uncharacterized protein n=1 Tax=Panagrolaimus sp. PS1159 TaxID=55785 RepID=A0AC35G1P1_9BILA